MNGNQINGQLLRRYGLSSLPRYESAATRNMRDMAVAAVRENAMIALTGPVGAGKSTLLLDVKQVLGEEVIWVKVYNKNKEKVSIGHIMSAMLMEISSETPRRDQEARARQLVRNLGYTVVRGRKKVCVVIEEAHRLNFNVLRSLKELREEDFAGQTPLFSVMLIGHPELRAKVEARKEVYWRTQQMDLSESSGWMSYPERLSFLKTLFGEAITEGARSRIAHTRTTPLEMLWLVDQKMREGLEIGKNRIDEEMLIQTLGELKEAAGASISDISAVTGLGRGTVSQALNGKYPEKERAVRDALLGILNRRDAV